MTIKSLIYIYYVKTTYVVRFIHVFVKLVLSFNKYILMSVL